MALVIVEERVLARIFSGDILVTSAKQCADIWNPPGFVQETRLDNGQCVWVLDDGDIKILEGLGLGIGLGFIGLGIGLGD